jgi:YD repeat-containing protein
LATFDFLRLITQAVVCTIDPLGRDGYYSGTTEIIPWTTLNLSVSAPARFSGDHSTRTVYDAAGNVTQQTDQLGHVTQYNYDRLNRLVEEIDADPDGSGPLTSPHTYYQYDAAGNQIAVVDPLGDTTAYQYDELGRLVKTTDPLGRVYATQYDAAGNVRFDIDAMGNKTEYVYDHLNRLTDVYDPDPDGQVARGGPHTQYAYDASGKRVRLTDPDGNTTTWTYDFLGRVTSETLSNGGATLPARTDGYDMNGNLLWEQDRDGRVTGYTYDHLNRKTLEKWYDNMTAYRSGTATYQIAYSYDKDGNLVQVVETKPGDLPPFSVPGVMRVAFG